MSFGNCNIAMLETCQKLSIGKFAKFISTFLDQNELSQTTHSRQVSGAGGIGYGGGDRISYQLSLAKDHPKGEEPTTINDDSSDLIKFKEALDLVKG